MEKISNKKILSITITVILSAIGGICLKNSYADKNMQNIENSKNSTQSSINNNQNMQNIENSKDTENSINNNSNQSKINSVKLTILDKDIELNDNQKLNIIYYKLQEDGQNNKILEKEAVVEIKNGEKNINFKLDENEGKMLSDGNYKMEIKDKNNNLVKEFVSIPLPKDIK